MLTPDQLDAIPDSLEALFAELDEFIVKDFARRVAKVGAISETAEWLKFRAEEIGLAEQELQKEVARVLKLSDERIKELFGDVAFTSADADKTRFESAGLSAERITESEFLQQYISAAYEQTMNEFRNFGRSMGFVTDGKGFRNLTDFYTEQLDLAQMQVSNGVTDYESAIRRIVKEASAKGVQVVNYESGYHMNLTSAARMVTLTGVNQMARLMNEGICDELGLDLVEVTAHAGARPTHQVWQGQIYSRSGKSKKYPDLVESTGLGQVDGLCGAYCRHNYYGYYEGSPRAYSEADLANIDPSPFMYKGREYTYYEATQKMRAMERQIRKTKRQQIMFAEAGEKFDDDFTSSAIRLRLQKDEYKRFARKANIRTRFERTWENGYDRSISARSAWRVRKQGT